MCTIAAAALATSIVGTGTAVVGGIQQGNAAEAQAEYEAQVAAVNAVSQKHQAEDAIARAGREELLQRQRTARIIGAQRAALAANGIVVDRDTALFESQSLAELGESDALIIRENGLREAFGFKARAVNFRNTAALARSRGRSARRAGLIGATGTAFRGATSLLGDVLDFQGAGLLKRNRSPQKTQFSFTPAGLFFARREGF